MFALHLPKLFLNFIIRRSYNTSRKLFAVSRVKCQACLSFQPSRAYETDDVLYSDETSEGFTESYRLPQLLDSYEKLKPQDTTIAVNPCWQSLRRTEYKCRSYQDKPIESYIDESAECIPECSMAAPRADLTKYKPSDKLNRPYQRTWVECHLQRRPVKAKCAVKPIHPKRRPRKAPPKGVCGQPPCTLGSPKLRLVPCKPFVCKKCPRAIMPGCLESVMPSKCKVGRDPSKCQRRLTKYPSFSECLMDKLPPRMPIECGCAKTPSLCSVWEYYRHLRS